MAKLSKEQIKAHNKCEELLLKESLTFDEKMFILLNWKENAKNINSLAGAFFTPIGLARDFTIEIDGYSLIDLCAGVGMLSFCAYHFKGVRDITCIEFNKDYYRVGKKILPEANWINASIFDEEVISNLKVFDQSISNPPFGKINTGVSDEFKENLKYKGSDFEYMTIEIASMISNRGTFILPQNSTPFNYSGNNCFEKTNSNKSSKFEKETKLEFEFNCGIDTSIYLKEWNGVSPMCEIVNFEFTPKQKEIKKGQLNMFD